MLTIFDLINAKTNAWVREEKENNQSAIGNMIKHIEKQNKLREPQIKAIEVYLWLKFVGQNNKLSEIIRKGLLFDEKIAQEYDYYTVFGKDYTTQFLNQFVQDNELKNLQKVLLNDSQGNEHDWDKVLDDLLHNFEYPNFLFSLPMGAGKTYLMACFIYLDLYFAKRNKSDKRFAHNFVVFAPHAAKTAILPSLRTIRDFNLDWILPANEAKELKQIIHIEILDSLSSKRKDKLQGNNPNLEKVNRITQTKDFGLVFITNAEKVVLERYDEKDRIFIETGQSFLEQKEFEEIKKTNELREKLSQIPYLSVILDEVHHTYKGSGKSEKKLREAVNILNQHQNLITVLGLSGTPFVKTKVEVGDKEIRLNQIQDVVYDYSLADGIGKFLKVPVVKSVEIMQSQFIKQALNEFFQDYDITYYNGTKSKITFYCPSIKKLNEEILPVIQEWYRENRSGKEDEIFRYYSDVRKEDKKYQLPKENLAIFNNLDKPYSDKRVVLLVAVGTEGWNCKSLTGVVLPRQKTTKNFVLQTTCRCLREVENAENEKALIFLEPGNYETLNNELRENYKLTIDDLKVKGDDNVPVIVRKSKLGKIKYKQIHKQFTIEVQQESTNYSKRLMEFDIEKFKSYFPYGARETTAKIGRTGLISQVSEELAFYNKFNYAFNDMIYDLSKHTYTRFNETDLIKYYGNELKAIFEQAKANFDWISNNPHITMQDLVKYIASFLAYEISYKTDIITEETEIELLEWDINQFSGIDYGNGNFLPVITKKQIHRIQNRPNRLEEDFEDEKLDPNDISFNYLPYRFDSDFEKNAILEMLKLAELKNLEVYYNGYKDDKLQNFYIKTESGNYTPDFLVLKRKNGQKYQNENNKGDIWKVLIIETKGIPYYTDEFKQKEKFIVEVFKKHNPNFEYICFKDEGENDFSIHLSEFKNLIKAF